MSTATALEIGAFNRSGLAQITDTNWDSNGTLRVTVREMIGGFDCWIGGKKRAIRVMRDLARRALPEYHEGQTKGARLVRTFYADGGHHATFAVTRVAR
ncbi:MULTISPECIES: hypothetical protein [unclassified Microbacterium]|uniref:hypothetical protein n=1 Tax=unclassified Microbacterium TaxID=2609290 RepID=UPI000EA9FE99|nr:MULTISPECIES: hypothetical protein [unclassified Microbacterium]MBT2484792.1 hypothetical protein [Microbacterium sp. ISL-108]RKN67668.1 hypothetical protein D7252_08775 [Microbacterium sp. CGR2]